MAHLSPDAPLVDLVVDDELVLRDVAFSDVTGYLLLPAGEHELRVFAHRLPQELEVGLDAAAGTSVGTGGVSGAPPRAARATRTLEPVTLFVTLEAGAYYTLNYVGFYEPPPVEEERGALSVSVDPDDTIFTLVGPRGYNVTLQGDALQENLVPGGYTVSAQRAGYQSTTYEVEVQPNVTTTLSATLQRLQEPSEALEQPDLTTNLRNPGGCVAKGRIATLPRRVFGLAARCRKHLRARGPRVLHRARGDRHECPTGWVAKWYWWCCRVCGV